MGVEQSVPPTNWVGFYCNIREEMNQQKIRIYFLKYYNFDDFLTFRIGLVIKIEFNMRNQETFFAGSLKY